MKAMILRTTILGFLAVALASCISDPPGPKPEPGPSDKKGSVTFVVSAPSPGDGIARKTTRTAIAGEFAEGNGHYPEGVPHGYMNYSADADTATYGTIFGGYPDAEAEAAAFAKAADAMAANYGKSPAARSVGTGRRGENKGQDAYPATRAIPEGSNHDNRIDELAILFFDTGGNYVDVKKVGLVNEPALNPVDGDITRRQFTLENFKDGTYTALFTANCRSEIDAYVAAGQNMTLDGFRTRLASPHTMSGTSPWNITPGDPGFKPFPMASKEVVFSVPVTRNFTEEPVELLRSLAKINLRIASDLTTGQRVKIEQIVVRNFNGTGRVIPAADWGIQNAGGKVDMFNPVALNAAASIVSPVGITYSYPAPSYTTESVDEIFVWEQLADNENIGTTNWGSDNFCLLVKLAPGFTVNGRNGSSETLASGRWYRVDLLDKENPADDNPKRVNLLRNLTYDISITGVNTRGYGDDDEAYLSPPGGLSFSIDARDAHDGDPGMNDNTFNGKYQLTTDCSVVVIGPRVGDKASVMVYTDYAGGYTSSGPAFNDGSMFTISGGYYSANTTEATTLTITAGDDWNGDYVRKTHFSIFAGEVYKRLILVQLPKPERVASMASTTDITGYTGAFWKTNQRGERLIGLKGGKDWSAFVLGGADWVVMDSKTSTDQKVGTNQAGIHNGSDPSFDTEHNVGSTVGWASGQASEGKEYFRLGLRTSHAATGATPARYALVYVVEGYVGNTEQLPPGAARILYLRQGEGADNLFPSRPGSVAFSPYNLTIPADKSYNTDNYAQLAPRGGAFTDYPTQAGAHFRGSGSYATHAYYPLNDINSTTWGPTSITDQFNPETDETCPPGYRRPTGESPNDEIPQSLWASTSPTITASAISDYGSNSVRGYYADGWFDRRKIEQQTYSLTGSTITVPNSVVANGTAGVAYTGRLFFNPSSGASNFFPAAGYKNNSGTSLFIGDRGMYWSSSMTPAGGVGGNQLHMYTGEVSIMFEWQKSDATSVRCVKIPDYTVKPALVLAPPGVIGIKHSDLDKPIAERQLTVRGSSTYKGTWVENIAKREGLVGLEEEPVYTVYFKWGSTVAVLGGANGSAFVPERVVWRDPGFSGTINVMTDFTMATPDGQGGHNIPYNANNGWGDPCDFVGGKSAANPSGWKTPTGNPWTYSDGSATSTPFGTHLGIIVDWATGRSQHGVKAKWTKEFGGGAVTDDGMVFLPASGSYSLGAISDLGEAGACWDSTYSISDTFSYVGAFETGLAASFSVSSEVDALPVRCVRPIPMPAGAVMASPGVIGIKKSDYDRLMQHRATTGDTGALLHDFSLTLKGSSTYKNTPVDNALTRAEFGGLEAEPVYAVYFKWGSTVAMIRHNSSEKSDIVWTNPEFNRTITDVNSITTANYRDDIQFGRNDVIENLPYGHGDPCNFTNGGTSAARAPWKTPTGHPWATTKKYNGSYVPFGTTESAVTDYNWDEQISIGNGLTGSVHTDDWSIFLPAGHVPGQIGAYWSTTKKSISPVHLSNLAFYSPSSGNKMLPHNGSTISGIYNVRCVPAEIPVDPALAQAPPGVIGIRASDIIAVKAGHKTPGLSDTPTTFALTMRGSNSFDGTPASNAATTARFGPLETEPVYAVYFKWGSQVAMLGGANNAQFRNDDVVWWPSAMTKPVGWNAFSKATPMAMSEGSTFVTDASQGHGDPCWVALGNPGQVFVTPSGYPWNNLSASVTTLAKEGDYRRSAMTINGRTVWKVEKYTPDPNDPDHIDDDVMFLPNFGQRDMSMYDNNTGNYWSSTMATSTAVSKLYNYASSTFTPLSNLSYQNLNYAYTVRCLSVKVSNDGGLTAPIMVPGEAGQSWTATVAMDTGTSYSQTVYGEIAGSNTTRQRKLVNHFATLEDMNGQPLTSKTWSKNAIDNSFRVRFPKVYYPNREIGIKATVTVTIGGQTLAYTVEQERLLPDKVTSYDYLTGDHTGSLLQTNEYQKAFRSIITNWGSSPANSAGTGANTTNNYKNHIPESQTAFLAGSKSETNREINYVNAALSSYRSDLEWSILRDWRVNNDGVLVMIDIIGNNIDTNYKKRPGSIVQASGYGEPLGETGVTASNGGEITQNSEFTPKKAYQYVLNSSPRVRINASDITKFYMDGIGTLYPPLDPTGAKIWPIGAVPLLTIVSANSSNGHKVGTASVLVDIDSEFVCFGGVSHFATAYMNGGRQTFMMNLMRLIEMWARYGDHFTDLLLEGDINDSDYAGQKPRSITKTSTDGLTTIRVAQPAPWDGYWGDNVDPNGITYNSLVHK